jgi:hypothetical protein
MNRRAITDTDVAWWIIMAVAAAFLLCLFLTGCSARRVAAPEVEEYDALTDPTPTQADLDQAVRDAIAEIKAHKRGR